MKGEGYMYTKVIGRIMVDSKDGRCFYHVLGDCKEFYDIESMETAHPEEKAFIELNKYELMRALYRAQKIINVTAM